MTPPLPPHAMDKPRQYGLAKGFKGEGVWVLRSRFRRKKHKGRYAGAFGGKHQ